MPEQKEDPITEACGEPFRAERPVDGQAVGAVETTSIARGVEAADFMVKAADVRLLMANPVCPGKYITVVGGTVAAVTSAVEAGKNAASETLVDFMVIPNVHAQVFKAFTATTEPKMLGAVGIIETFSLASAIVAGDQAVKSAAVDLLEIRLARALGGKAYVILTGEVSAVRSAVESGVLAAREQGLLLGSTVIPSPHPDLLATLL